MLLTLLGKELPPNQYALGDARRYFHLWRARLAMYFSGALVMACAVLWVGGNGWGYFDAIRSADRMNSEAEQYDARYRAALARP